MTWHSLRGVVALFLMFLSPSRSDVSGHAKPPTSSNNNADPPGVTAEMRAQLRQALGQAVGVYLSRQEPAASWPADAAEQLNRTVLVTASNFGYLNHLRNFKCWCQRRGYKALVFAMDERAYAAMTAAPSPHIVPVLWKVQSSSWMLPPHGHMVFVPPTSPRFSFSLAPPAGRGRVLAARGSRKKVRNRTPSPQAGSPKHTSPRSPRWRAGPARFRSHAFNVIVTRKKQATLAVMQLGYVLRVVCVRACVCAGACAGERGDRGTRWLWHFASPLHLPPLALTALSLLSLSLCRGRYDILFADTDVVLLQDPLPLVLWRGVDYVHSVNKFCPIPAPFNVSAMEVRPI